jgi:UDP-N-acetylmuramoyl-tripeptide--D-alanyl-D-alanine ligase
MALWHWSELCAALNLPVVDGPDVTGIAIDSRRVVPGDLFVALPGDPGPRFNTSSRSDRDGHDYVSDAFARGAAGVLVHRVNASTEPASAGPELKVVDTLDALWALARASRARLTCPVVAITGSSGKTTCKTLLAAALEAYATEGSENNHIGVPLSLARAPRDSHSVVLELGMNHPGEIAPLARLARPDVAVVLNVQAAHVENFSDPDGIRGEKLSIAAGLLTGGVLVVHDAVDTTGLRTDIEIKRFGREPQSEGVLLEVEGHSARYRIGKETIDARVPGGGDHRALTLAAVLTVLDTLGLDLRRASALPEELVPAGRGRYHRFGDRTIIDDSYNANPSSMASALVALDRTPAQRRIAILGEMLELGPQAPDFHRQLAPLCEQLDYVICVGPGTMPLFEVLSEQGIAARCFERADDTLLEFILALSAPGDLLLVKGSNRVFWQHDFVRRLSARLGGGDRP